NLTLTGSTPTISGSNQTLTLDSGSANLVALGSSDILQVGALAGTTGSTTYVCLNGSNQLASCSNGSGGSNGFVSLAPSSADNPNSANTAIFVNQSGAGSLLRLQQGSSDKFAIDNSGN